MTHPARDRVNMFFSVIAQSDSTDLWPWCWRPNSLELVGVHCRSSKIERRFIIISCE